MTMDGRKFELVMQLLSGKVALARRYASGELRILDLQPEKLSEQAVKAAAGYLKSQKDGIVAAKLPDGSRLVYYPPEVDTDDQKGD